MNVMMFNVTFWEIRSGRAVKKLNIWTDSKVQLRISQVLRCSALLCFSPSRLPEIIRVEGGRELLQKEPTKWTILSMLLVVLRYNSNMYQHFLCVHVA